MTMNGDPRDPESQLPSGGAEEGAPRTGTRADPAEDLRADLETVAAAWSALTQAQPPDLLDQAVLNAARRALADPPRSARRPLGRPLGWLGALATAGVVVLAVTVVLEQSREAPMPPTPASDGYEAVRSPTAPKLEATDQDAARAVSAETRSSQQSVPAPAAAMEQDLAEPAREASPARPEAWIDRLRELKTGGDSEAFQRELAAFRATYPAYPLPPELLE